MHRIERKFDLSGGVLAQHPRGKQGMRVSVHRFHVSAGAPRRFVQRNRAAALARASRWGVLLGLLVPCVAGFIGDKQHAGNEDNNSCDDNPKH
jgi:hypothetical protein